MKKSEYIQLIQTRVATVCVGPSTTRGCEKGTLANIRLELRGLDLKEFAKVRDDKSFNEVLSDATDAVRNIDGVNSFGLARKCVNLFLRDCTYNHYLRTSLALDKIETYLELPIDSKVGKAIRRKNKRTAPVWSGINTLTIAEHAAYQAEAQRMARNHRFNRVHVDLLLWQ